MRSVVGRVVAVVVAVFVIQGATIAAPSEFRLDRNGVGPIVVVTEISITGSEVQFRATARNDSGQSIHYAKFCVSREVRAKGCDFELWTTAVWLPGEELNWAPLKGRARQGVENLAVKLTELKGATPLVPAGFGTAASSVPSSLRPVQPGTRITIQDGTPLRFRLKGTVSSAEAKVGDVVNFETLDEIKSGDFLLIPKGSLVPGAVTEAVSKKNFGRPGELKIVVDHARLINGEKIPLRPSKEKPVEEETSPNRRGVPLNIALIPAPFFLLVHGKEATFSKGTEMTAFVHGDYSVDPSKFSPAAPVGAPQTVPRPASTVIASNAALTNDDITGFRQAGLSDEAILAKIKTSKGAYKVNSDNIVALWNAGVSDTVILAMIEAATR